MNCGSLKTDFFFRKSPSTEMRFRGSVFSHIVFFLNVWMEQNGDFLGKKIIDADSSVRVLIGPRQRACIIGECELTNGGCKLHDDGKERQSFNKKIAISRIIMFTSIHMLLPNLTT